MTLKFPFQISARLLPSLVIGGATIQMERAGKSDDGRDVFKYIIDLPSGKTHTNTGLKSGVGGCSLQEAFDSLLSFLSAEAEDEGLFPRIVSRWCKQHDDEISMMKCELEGAGDLIAN